LSKYLKHLNKLFRVRNTIYLDSNTNYYTQPQKW